MRWPWNRDRFRPRGLTYQQAGQQPYYLDCRLSYNGFRRGRDSWELKVSHAEMKQLLSKKAIIKVAFMPKDTEIMVAIHYSIG